MQDNLLDWLAYIERQHPRSIALGLERVRQVKQAMGLTQAVPLITVGGTNGKGSTCAFLERILLAAGYRTGLYTSPHLLRYNERVRVNGIEAGDAALCNGFKAVEAARGDTPLTYFEFGTLAAWHVFAQHPLDVIILEVGLGGRLDAVNVFDADCAILTSIAFDHMEYLGDTREKIGFEKAGIFRSGKPAIVGDPQPPQSVIDHAQKIGAQLRVSGRDFGFSGDRAQWQYWSESGEGVVRKSGDVGIRRSAEAGTRRSGLAYPSLRGANQLLNASAVLAALDSLRDVLPVDMQAIRRGLMETELPGRFQVLPGKPTVVLDVAHNPHAAAVLADNLGNMGFYPETWAVFGMLGDKDIAGVVRNVMHRVDHWLPCSLEGARGANAENLTEIFLGLGVAPAAVHTFATPALAYAQARERASENDRIIVFGSFLTVAEVMRVSEKRGHG